MIFAALQSKVTIVQSDYESAETQNTLSLIYHRHLQEQMVRGLSGLFSFKTYLKSMLDSHSTNKMISSAFFLAPWDQIRSNIIKK